MRDIDNATPEETDTERGVSQQLDRVKKLLDRFDAQLHMMGNDRNATTAIFHEDEAFEIALPWAGFDGLQSRILARRGVPDPVLYTQLFDLVQTLAGRAILDIGSYSGLQAMVLRRFLDPVAVHMVEPLAMAQVPLARTIAANPEGAPVTLHKLVIDDATSPIARGATRSERLSDTAFLRRAGGKLTATRIDDMAIGNLGLINLDMAGQKIYALKGARQVLETQRPYVLVNLAGRDSDEMAGFMTPLSYKPVRMGHHATLFLPE